MIITLYGKDGNHWTDMVRQALKEVGFSEDAVMRDHGDVVSIELWEPGSLSYSFIEKFEWARDPKTCKDQACHIGKDGVARVQKMPTIHLEGDFNKIGEWLMKGKFTRSYPVTSWHYLAQENEFWIVGVEDCLDFVRGASWPSA